MFFHKIYVKLLGMTAQHFLKNGYSIGPRNVNCGKNIYTSTKWIKLTGVDTIYVRTFQHRLYE